VRQSTYEVLENLYLLFIRLVYGTIMAYAAVFNQEESDYE
jgi:hypothetical protein